MKRHLHLEQAFLVEDITVSKALFGNLEAGEVDYFKLKIPDGLTIDSSLFVGGGCSENFKPQLYLLSPNTTSDSAKNDEVTFTYLMATAQYLHKVSGGHIRVMG